MGRMAAYDSLADAQNFAAAHAVPAEAAQAAQQAAEQAAQQAAQQAAMQAAGRPRKPPRVAAGAQVAHEAGQAGVVSAQQSSGPPPLPSDWRPYTTAAWLVWVSDARPLTPAEQAELAAALLAMDPNNTSGPLLIYKYKQNVLKHEAYLEAQKPKPTPTSQPTHKGHSSRPA